MPHICTMIIGVGSNESDIVSIHNTPSEKDMHFTGYGYKLSVC